MEQKKQRTRIPMKGVIRVFVISSTKVELTPAVYIAKQKPFGDHDFLMRTYMRATGKERQIASKEREKEIFSQIRKVRQRIRIQAEVYYPDRNTKIVAVTAQQKMILHCSKLMAKFTEHKPSNWKQIKTIRDESVNSGQRKVEYDHHS